ncbi:MAG: capsular polysaccharide biosynthesis protein [Oscillospiraceae bacterium]|nr:capsular polysaccharide biosynthesis protein [Oscillospiraceae bacterium]
MGCVDLHSHFLPGIDDGSKDLDMTRAMLTMCAEQGVDLMCATPHFYADSMRLKSFLSRRQEAYEKTRPVADELGIDIALGAEVAFFAGMSDADGIEALCYEGTKTMLVEMPFREWTDKDIREIEKLLRGGIRPVIAHMERFFRFQKGRRLTDAMFDLPVYVQLNAECLLGFMDRLRYLKFFGDGRAQLLASDCHNTTSRSPNLAQGRAVVEKKYGPESLEKMDSLARLLTGKLK